MKQKFVASHQEGANKLVIEASSKEELRLWGLYWHKSQYNKIIKMWCVLAQITINKLQFILYKHKDKYLKCVGKNHI